MPLSAVRPVVDEMLLGFMIGNIVGVAVEQRARRRPGHRSTGVRDAWGLAGAAIGLAWGIIRELS